MENEFMSLLTMIGQYGASVVIALYGVYKGSQKSISFIKRLTEKKSSEGKVTVNVNSSPKIIDDNYKDFLYLLLEQGKILKAMHDLRSDVLKEQMDYFRKHTQSIKMNVTNIMVELLRDAGIEDTNFGTYFTNFENFIDVAEIRIEQKYKQMCVDNHFSEYTIKEYSELIDRNICIIEGTIQEVLRRRYPQQKYIKNFDKICEIKNDLNLGLKDCFQFARDVSIEKETKVNNARCIFESKISKIMREEYSLEI